MIRTLQSACLALSVGATQSLAQPREWADDFSARATYDSASLFAPCYGGPPTKYTLIEFFQGDVTNQRALSGQGRLLFSNRIDSFPPPYKPHGRLEVILVGWVGWGIGCTGEPPPSTTNESFTSPDLCLYGGMELTPWGIRNRGYPEEPTYNPDLFGFDRAPGVADVDDDQDGTTDEDDESPGLWPTNVNGGYGNRDGTGFGAGIDAAPGDVGVDDDANGTTDDIGETGWPNTDDGDDLEGNFEHGIWMRLELMTSTGIALMLKQTPGSGGDLRVFEYVYLWDWYELEDDDEGELAPGFWTPYTHYNWVFCSTGTCYGATLWVEHDMGNPSETIGPVVSTYHTTPYGGQPDIWPVGFSHGWARGQQAEEAFIRHQRWLGNSNFSDTYWVCSGDPTAADFTNAVFGYPSPSSDLDNDRDVDVNDFLTFSACMNGSSNPPKPNCQNTQADLDGDGDVDVNDFLTLSSCFNGSLRRPNQSCFPPRFVRLADCDPPVNDTCDGAEPVDEGVYEDYISQGAVTVSPIPSCDTDEDKGRDLWFKYTPSCTGTATISTCDATGLSGVIPDVVLTVYDGCGGNELACEQSNNCGGGSDLEEVVLAVQHAQPVYIQIAAEDFEHYGHFRMTITNTNCGGGESGGGSGGGGSQGATGGDPEGPQAVAPSEPQIFDGDTPAENVSYVYTPTCSGQAVFGLCDSTGGDRSAEGIYFVVADPTSDTLMFTEVADCLDATAQAAMTLTAGQPVYVFVYRADGAQALEGFALHVTCGSP